MPKSHASSFFRHILLTLLLIVIASITFAFYVYWEREVDHANEMRFKSFMLANQLRQSSDDLTRMVRTYVRTSDPIYKKHYQEILDIRDGKAPRPICYNDIYWDLVLSDDKRPCQNGPAISLLELMRQTGFTDNEFEKLKQAKANSDDLTRTEISAMALIESYPDNDSKRLMADRMLSDAKYHQAKANIMRPISEFNHMMDQRTLRILHVTEQTAYLLRIAFIAIGVLLAFTLWRVYRALHSILGCSVDELQEHISKLGGGNFENFIPVAQDDKDSVANWLAETQRNLATMNAERKKAEALMSHQASFDYLTNLPNRSAFFEALSKELSKARRGGKFVALLLLDLDGFKSVNDEQGHEAGDIVLKEVSRRWLACIREGDTVARIGGDEFAVIVSALDDPTQVVPIAEKLIHALTPKFTLYTGHEYSIGVSIGISVYPSNASEMDSLLAAADIAMYESKKRGKNTYTLSSASPAGLNDDEDWVLFDKSYLLGIQELDDQHRKLVNLVNEIHRSQKNDNEADVKMLFNELIKYTLLHFEVEHNYMLNFKYGGF